LRPQQSFVKDRMIVCCAGVAGAERYGARMCGFPREKISYCNRASDTEGTVRFLAAETGEAPLRQSTPVNGRIIEGREPNRYRLTDYLN